jgi:hypothetical protein
MILSVALGILLVLSAIVLFVWLLAKAREHDLAGVLFFVLTVGALAVLFPSRVLPYIFLALFLALIAFVVVLPWGLYSRWRHPAFRPTWLRRFWKS